jgi:feruloyl esterase
MSTDTGHNSTSGDGSWATNPESVTDWGWRAMHGSIVIAKQLTKAYYGTTPQFNYYSGCSTGGRQGLKEAEEFPDDFDGVLAGAPAWWTNRLQLWNGKVRTYNAPVNSAHHIPESLFSVIGDEVLRQCDPQDGVVDRIIQDPWRCDLRLETLLCNTTNPAAGSCLSGDQFGTLYHIYNDWIETNQTFIFPHLLHGSEAQWSVLINNGTPVSLGTDYIQYFLGLGKSASETFDYENVLISERMNPGNATADNFDLSPFQRKGGKLLHYHGLSDGLIAPGSSIYFHDQVLRTLVPRGIDVGDFYRLFLVPGMQ